MNKVTITISGSTGSGKSSLAQYIERHLRNQYGMRVGIRDDDGSDAGAWGADELNDRLTHLAKQVEVEIVTKPAYRSSPNDR